MSAFPTDEEYEKTVFEIYKRAGGSNVSVIVIFGTHFIIRHLLKAALKYKSEAPRRFTWIGSDGWSNRLKFVGDEADPALGALTIMMRKGTIGQKFKDRYSSLNLANYPWRNKTYVVDDLAYCHLRSSMMHELFHAFVHV